MVHSILAVCLVLGPPAGAKPCLVRKPAARRRPVPRSGRGNTLFASASSSRPAAPRPVLPHRERALAAIAQAKRELRHCRTASSAMSFANTSPTKSLWSFQARDVSRAARPHHDLSRQVHRSRSDAAHPEGRAAALYQDAVERPSPKTGKPMAAASHRFYLALVKGLFVGRAQRVSAKPLRRRAARGPR